MMTGLDYYAIPNTHGYRIRSTSLHPCTSADPVRVSNTHPCQNFGEHVIPDTWPSEAAPGSSNTHSCGYWFYRYPPNTGFKHFACKISDRNCQKWDVLRATDGIEEFTPIWKEFLNTWQKYDVSCCISGRILRGFSDAIWTDCLLCGLPSSADCPLSYHLWPIKRFRLLA